MTDPTSRQRGAPDIDKTILANVNINKYPVVRPTWALKPGLTDPLVVGRNVTLTLINKGVMRSFLGSVARQRSVSNNREVFSLGSVLGTRCHGKIVLLVQPKLQEGEFGRSRQAQMR
jgi:hypothetical protein